MLKLKIVTVGKLKENAFVELEQEYLKRFKSFAKISLVEIPDESHSSNAEATASRRKEGEKIQKQIRDGAFVVALDEGGKTISTVQFATLLKPYDRNGRDATFVIGGSTGLDQAIKKRANFLLSLSPLTFTHNFARILLLEQLYRITTILTGKKYHY